VERYTLCEIKRTSMRITVGAGRASNTVPVAVHVMGSPATISLQAVGYDSTACPTITNGSEVVGLTLAKILIPVR